MRSARLDPFSSRLLAIRLRNAQLPRPEAEFDERDDEEPEPTDADIASDGERQMDEPCMPGRSAPDARVPTGSPTGQVTAELMAGAHHVVASTDCHTCGDHDVPEGAWNLREITDELRQLKERVSHLEYAAQVHGVDAVAAAIKEGKMEPGLLG